jgi:hypothetical protein
VAECDCEREHVPRMVIVIHNKLDVFLKYIGKNGPPKQIISIWNLVKN